MAMAPQTETALAAGTISQTLAAFAHGMTYDDIPVDVRERAKYLILDAVGIDRSCLVAVDSENRNAAVSARNIEHVDTIRVDQLNVFEMLNHRYLVVDKASIEAFLDGSAWNKDEEAA